MSAIREIFVSWVGDTKEYKEGIAQGARRCRPDRKSIICRLLPSTACIIPINFYINIFLCHRNMQKVQKPYLTRICDCSSSLSNLGLIQQQTHFEMQHHCLWICNTRNSSNCSLPMVSCNKLVFLKIPWKYYIHQKRCQINSTLLESTIFGHLGDISDSGLLFWIQASKAGKDKAKQRIFRKFFSRVLTKIYLQRAILQT